VVRVYTPREINAYFVNEPVLTAQWVNADEINFKQDPQNPGWLRVFLYRVAKPPLELTDEGSRWI
jgi:hypothetical protein